jgi:hypothetical protein
MLVASEVIEKPADLQQHDLARLAVDMIHRIVVHYALWFVEVEHQFGMDKALDVLEKSWKTSHDIQMERLGKVLGFEMHNGVPKALAEMPKDKLLHLISNIGINWLANDGVWFQAVESSWGMYDAKRCNDSCWVRFSPFEAWSIKRFLKLEEEPGLEGLKKALRFRLYGTVNIQSIVDESPSSIIFYMNDCRVQSARKRKGLDDYGCKSAGLVEYRSFAETIDKRIKTECIGCPPDAHPEDWWCAWRFILPE